MTYNENDTYNAFELALVQAQLDLPLSKSHLVMLRQTTRRFSGDVREMYTYIAHVLTSYVRGTEQHNGELVEYVSKFKWMILEGKPEGYTRLMALLMSVCYLAKSNYLVNYSLNSNAKYPILDASYLTLEEAVNTAMVDLAS